MFITALTTIHNKHAYEPDVPTVHPSTIFSTLHINLPSIPTSPKVFPSSIRIFDKILLNTLTFAYQ